MATLFRPVVAGTTDVSVFVRVLNEDGTPKTDAAYNSAGIDIEYRRDGAASVDITEATLASASAAHSDGGFIHIGNGYCRVDLPDAACASGAAGVLVHGTMTNAVIVGCYVPLLAVNPYDAVRMGLTALPNAAAAASGGLFTRGTGAGQINQDANGRIDVNVAAISADSAAADNLESYCDGTTPQPVNATHFGGTAGTFASGRPEVNTTHAAGTAWNSGAIGASTLANDTITAAKIAADAIGASELAADAVSEIQSGLATTAALATVASYIDTEVAAIKAVTDNLPNSGSLTSLATAAELAKVPKSDSNVTWNSTALASINAECDTAIADAAFRFALHATGTLSGTHSSTTADLGGSAPSTDISGMTLYIPSRGFVRIVDSYDTGTGVATFESTSATLTNADPWYLFATPTASAASPIPADVKKVNAVDIIGDGSSGNKFRGNP